jgi:hypothetical protein
MHQLPWRKGASTRGGARRLQRIAVVLHKSQQQPLSMQGMRERRQTRRKRGAEGERARANLASLHEAHRLSLSARANHSLQRSSWSAGNSTDAKGSEDRMTSPGANARSATTHSPRPGLRVVATWNRSLRYRSRASCRRGESARPSGAPLARIGLPPQSSASSRAAAARRTIASTAVTTCALSSGSLCLVPGGHGQGSGLWGAMSLKCGHAACRKALTPPFLQCAKCKAAAYCSKACQVRAPTHEARCARARA